MKGKKVFILVSLTLLLITSPLLGACGKDEQPEPTAELPGIIALTTYPVGSSTYTQAAALREVIEEFSPMKARVEPYAGSVAQMISLSQGDFLVSAMPAAISTYTGWFEFAAPEWGPQRLYQVWVGNTFAAGYMVRADSGINSLEDLKGKKIAISEGVALSKMLLKALLGWNQWTEDDVETKVFGNTALVYQSVLEGTADATLASTQAPVALELEASSHGVKFLEMPLSNTGGWERFLEFVPAYKPVIPTRGPNSMLEQKPQLIGSSFGIWAYDFAEENVVYEVVKAIHQGYDIIKDMHPALSEWTVDSAIEVGPTWMPFHPGAVKYFKEAGVWTTELEKWQSDRLKATDEMIETFNQDREAWHQKYADIAE